MPNEFVDLSRRNIPIWFLLAFQAGAVNSGGFLACGRFVTHTTGFATHFGVELAERHWEVAIGLLSVPVFFLLGAMITSYFVDLRLLHGRRANYHWPATLILLCFSTATFLGKLGAFGFFGSTTFRQDYLFLVLLCLASGLQNALVTNASGMVVRTTHLTGVTTDLGTGLVRILFSPDEYPRLSHERLATLARAGIIASFVLGSAAAAVLFLRAEYLGFALPVATSLLLLRYFIVRTKAKGVPMRALALVALFVSFSAVAGEPPSVAPGNYRYAETFSVVSKSDFEVVYAMNEKGQSRLAQLQLAGFTCNAPSGREIYLCQKAVSTDGAEESLQPRVEKDLAQAQLTLGRLEGNPALDVDSPSYQEYSVPQAVDFAGKHYAGFRLARVENDWSVRFGAEETEDYTQFALSPNGALGLLRSYTVTASKTNYSVFWVSAAFRRM